MELTSTSTEQSTSTDYETWPLTSEKKLHSKNTRDYLVATMSSITPNNIPVFTEEKRLVGRKNWNRFKSEVLLQVGAKGMSGYLSGTIGRPTLASSPPPPTPTPAVPATPAAGTNQTAQVPQPTTTTTTVPTVTPFFSPTPSIQEWDARDRYVASIIISNTVDPVGIGIDEDRSAFRI
ncbi:hypothetical protein PQX77_013218 [Marasmius sp. AFHP31]|nr:hypothetical protein PQX77_013218 [Marasmius sp. AFHP31]